MNETIELYFDWLTSIICDKKHSFDKYNEVLWQLFDIEFLVDLPNIPEGDMNRAADGIDLRSTFAVDKNLDYTQIRKDFGGPCSVLEMMIGLALRCENSIMGDDEFGDRTSLWFWTMMSNLKLDKMTNNRFNQQEFDIKMDIFMSRKYTKNGNGGLFYVKNPTDDLRNVEIWVQLCWFLNEFME